MDYGYPLFMFDQNDIGRRPLIVLLVLSALAKSRPPAQARLHSFNLNLTDSKGLVYQVEASTSAKA